jgi:hypothetical protein
MTRTNRYVSIIQNIQMLVSDQRFGLTSQSVGGS